jgi:RIO kinase 1
VVRLIKSGKESQVYLTRRFYGGRNFYFAAKVHKPRAQRSFKRDKAYRAGWYFSERDHRIQRAVEHMTRYGKGVVGGLWVNQEFEALQRLWRGKASVPAPIHKNGDTILMTYIGEPERPAPKLCEVVLESDEANEAIRQIIENLKIFFKLGIIHGDLSSFNILYWEGKIWIIDLPQSVDLYRNPDSMDLLYRDLENLCAYFLKQGVDCHPEELFSRVTGLTYAAGRTYEDLLMLSYGANDSTV